MMVAATVVADPAAQWTLTNDWVCQMSVHMIWVISMDEVQCATPDDPERQLSRYFTALPRRLGFHRIGAQRKSTAVGLRQGNICTVVHSLPGSQGAQTL